MAIFFINIISAIMESYVMLRFGSIICKKNIRFINIFIIGFLIVVFSSLFYNPIFKCIYLVLIFLYFVYVLHIQMKDSFKIILYGMMFLIIFETMYGIVFEYLLNIDLSLITREIRLIYLFPLRIIQLIIIKLMKRK